MIINSPCTAQNFDGWNRLDDDVVYRIHAGILEVFCDRVYNQMTLPFHKTPTVLEDMDIQINKITSLESISVNYTVAPYMLNVSYHVTVEYDEPYKHGWFKRFKSFIKKEKLPKTFRCVGKTLDVWMYSNQQFNPVVIGHTWNANYEVFKKDS